MAREILLFHSIDPKQEVDHRDRNPLNNQFENLRPATKSQNMANRSLQVNNSSGCRGVNFHKDCDKYQARIQIRGNYIHIGYFSSLKEAARAYDKAAIRFFGEFAVLNFQPECVG